MRLVLAGAMLAVPMVALALLMRRAKRQQARATSLTRIISADDLYLLFEIRPSSRRSAP